MDEEKRGRVSGKTVLLSIAAGIIALAIFLAAYYFFFSQRESVFYEGEGRYTAVMASGSGVSGEYGGMEVELLSDGNCRITLGEKNEKGKWKRIGDRVEISVGRQKMTGTLIGDTLEIMSGDSKTKISFFNTESVKTAEIPAGSWKLVSVTDGFSVYSDDTLRKLGYEDSYIEIGENGKGTAKILTQVESEITVEGEYINLNGMLLPFSFSEDQLSVSYAEGVTLAFEK